MIAVTELRDRMRENPFRLFRIHTSDGKSYDIIGSSTFSVDLIEQRRFKGARASRARCLASRQTPSGLFSLSAGKSEEESGILSSSRTAIWGIVEIAQEPLVLRPVGRGQVAFTPHDYTLSEFME